MMFFQPAGQRWSADFLGALSGNLFAPLFEPGVLPTNAFQALRQQLRQYYGDCPVHMITDAVQPKNRLGTGSRAGVYRIPKLPDFVLAVDHDVELVALPEGDHFLPVPDPMPGLNIGQIVGRMANGRIRVLRFQAGTTSNIPFARFFAQYGIDALLGEGVPMQSTDIAPYRKLYARHLQKVAAMPQRAYDDLARRIVRLRLAGLHLDPCSLNILVDSRNQVFNTVDHAECIGPYENVLGMACALLDTMFVDLDAHALTADGLLPLDTTANNPALVRLRGQIMRKILLAAERSGLEWPEESCPRNRFGYRQRSFDMMFALEISGLAGLKRPGVPDTQVA